jgi:hypothetical protein
MEMVGGGTKVYVSPDATGLSARSSSTTMRTFTTPAASDGNTAVQRVVDVQLGVTVFDPTISRSAPGIGRKPLPMTVIFSPADVGPALGDREDTEAVLRRVA